MRYQPGVTIAWRSVDREKRIVQTAIPWTVVRQDERSIVFYLVPGTTIKQRTGRYDWLAFQPDPGWSIPVLPEGWRDFEPR